jgi:hypothetical protein
VLTVCRGVDGCRGGGGGKKKGANKKPQHLCARLCTVCATGRGASTIQSF